MNSNQDRPGRSDRSSTRGEVDRSSDQFEQRPRNAEQDASQRGQEQDARRRSSDQSDQYRQDRRSDYQFDRQSSDRSSNNDAREQAGRGGQRQSLGIEFDQQNQSGLTVTDIQRGSAAAQAGLRSGDQIVAINGRAVTNQQQFFSWIGSQSGRQIPVVISRGGRQYTIQLMPSQVASNQSSGSSEDVAWLGVFLQDNEDGDQNGAVVTQVYPAGPAARAGLRPGDVITHVGESTVRSSADLISAIEEEKPGEQVQLAVHRSNQEIKVPTVLGSRRAFTWTGYGQEQYGQEQYGREPGGQSGQSSQSSGGQSRGSSSRWSDDQWSSVPPFAMHLEHERRMYEQHQRIEDEIVKLQAEVRQLRELLQRR